MPVRKIIQIDEEKCDGCGQCVLSCAEGAIRIVGGKAKLVSDVYCDGLGVCLGHCPRGAITIIERDAADFDEAAARQLGASQPAPLCDHSGGGCPARRRVISGSTCWPSRHPNRSRRAVRPYRIPHSATGRSSLPCCPNRQPSFKEPTCYSRPNARRLPWPISMSGC